MALKVFNKETNEFETLSFKSKSIIKDSKNTVFSSTKTYDDIGDAINSKLSKSGDTITGPIFLDEGGCIQSYVGSDDNIVIKNHIGINEIEDGLGDGVNDICFTVTNTRSSRNTMGTVRSSFNLRVDSTPKSGSNNLITSGTLYGILDNIYSRLEALEHV